MTVTLMQLAMMVATIGIIIGAGIWLVGRQTVVSKEFVLAQAINDDAPACAFHFRCEVNPTTDVVNLLILKCVGVNRETEWRRRSVGVLGILFAAVQQG